MFRLIKPNIFTFSTPKSPFIKVSRFKLSPEGSYTIYQTTKQKYFGMVSFGMTVCIGLSAYTFYQVPVLGNFIPLALMTCVAIIFQKRVFRTLQKMSIQKNGEVARMQTYGLFGLKLFHFDDQINIAELRGITKNKWDRGVVISGGGYRVKPFKFYFHQEGVIDKRVFDGVVGGTLVKFSDIL